MPAIRAFHRLSDLLDRLMEVVIVIMLGLMVILTGAQIFCRIFLDSLSWSEEATRYLLIWSTMFGAGCVYKHGGHIAITVLRDSVRGKASMLIRLATHLLCGLLFVIIAWQGYQYYFKQGAQLSAAMRIPMRYVYTCIPIGCGIMVIHAADAILSILTGDGAGSGEAHVPADSERKDGER